MKLYISEQEFGNLQARFAGVDPSKVDLVQIEYAWHLRQRDTTQALCLVDNLIAKSNKLSPEEQTGALARLTLTRAECHWLLGNLDSARNEVRSVVERCEKADDFECMADAFFLQSFIANDSNQGAEREAAFHAAAVNASLGGDALRQALVDARRANADVFVRLGAAKSKWTRFMEQCRVSPDVALRGMAHSFTALVAHTGGDMATALESYVEAVRCFRESGQLRAMLTAMSNLADCFAGIDAWDSALLCYESALASARRTGWSFSIATVLIQLGRALTLMGKPELARKFVAEAHERVHALAQSVAYLSLLQCEEALARSLHQYEEALTSALKLEQLAIERGAITYQLEALCGQAQSLSSLGEPQRALAAANLALNLARFIRNRVLESESLQVIAAIYEAHALPSPIGTGERGSLHFMREALAALQSIEGHRVSSKVFTRLELACLTAGREEEARTFSELSNAARLSEQHEEAMTRAVTLSARQKAEQFFLDGAMGSDDVPAIPPGTLSSPSRTTIGLSENSSGVRRETGKE